MIFGSFEAFLTVLEAELGAGTACELARGTISGAPCGAHSTLEVRRGRRGHRVRICPLGPQVELPLGHDPRPPVGHDLCKGWGEIGDGAACVNLPTGAVRGAPCGARSA